MDAIFGLPTPVFTGIHVAISLMGIAAGYVVLGGLMTRRFLAGWNRLFLVFTILTSVTGFLFPSKAFGPAHAVGLVSLAVLAVALVALFRFGRRGRARVVYIVTATTAQWSNVFVLIVQAFQKSPVLRRLAPTDAEPLVLAAQFTALVLTAWFGWRAIKSGA